MSQVIWKFAMPTPGFWRTVEMPEDAVCVKSSTRTNILQSWWKLDPSAPLVKRHFTVVATGQEFDPSFIYHDTIFEGSLVWHLLEDPNAVGQDKIEGRDYG